MARYTLTQRIYNTMIGRGYKLVCKICEVPLQVEDCVESKPSKYRRRKFYHCDCYDGSFIELPELTEEEENEENEPE